ncbi:MAG: low molecular weight phosphatase family protein [Rhodospirillales bacterium]|nr:low molecular weight phosphatase family protein [Rhodospirillales bacterium]
MPERLPGAVLFACTMNAVRSVMAAGLMRHLLGHKVFVDSAGLRSSEPVDPFVVSVMEEIGIDVSDHRPKTFEELEDSFFDLIVSLSPEAQHSAVEMTRTMACDVEFWPTLDASIIEGSRDQRLQAYREVRDHLMRRIKRRFALDLKPQV